MSAHKGEVEGSSAFRLLENWSFFVCVYETPRALARHILPDVDIVLPSSAEIMKPFHGIICRIDT